MKKIYADPDKLKIHLDKQKQRAKGRYDLKKNTEEFKKNKNEHQKNRREQLKIMNTTGDLEESFMGNYKSSSSFGKAVKKVCASLPIDEANRDAVLKRVFFKYFPDQFPSASRNRQEENEVDSLVKEFYERDDISQQLPGSRQFVTLRLPDKTKERKQKRIMSMTLSEALCLFKENYPDAKIGKTKFCTMKPAFVSCVSEMKQNGCLCKHCENMKLLFSALKVEMKPNDVNKIQDLLKNFSCMEEHLCEKKECLDCATKAETFLYDQYGEEDLGLEIELLQWTQEGHRMKMLSNKVLVLDCVKNFLLQLNDYKQHVIIKISQSSLFQEAIKSSNEEVIVVQCDFAENYKCVSQDEIQSAHFHQQPVAIFTVCAWSGDKKISKVCISDDTTHSKFSVYKFLQLTIADLKKSFPSLSTVKVFSDGCAAQFKNRWTLSNVLYSSHDFGVKMTWDFFAPGHGKGAVDGIGATVKRVAYRAVMGRQNRINSAEDFADCIKTHVKGIQCTYVPAVSISEVELFLSDRWKNTKELPGITKYFSFKEVSEDIIGAATTGISVNWKEFTLKVNQSIVKSKRQSKKKKN